MNDNPAWPAFWRSCWLTFWSILLLPLLLLPSPSHARQAPEPVKQAVADWLHVQNQGLPGEVSVDIGELDPANQLAPCQQFDVSRPTGARLWGRTNVQVRCLDAAGWRIYLPVHVRVQTVYLISARPIARGQTLVQDDITAQMGDLADLPANILTEDRLAIGKVASANIPAGQPLRSNLLKAQMVIRQGQSVKVLSRGPGFAVSSEGRALNNAAAGEIARIRLANGQVVSGIAQTAGHIELSY